VTSDRLRLVVVGAHLSGQPLNHQLTSRGATLEGATRTADRYRLFALPTDPPKPGLQRVGADDPAGRSIEVEVWSLAPAAFADFVDAVPAPLGIGRVQLADGSEAAGFICEPIGLAGATEITSFGGWRAYRAAADEPR
jgi:allophanate hydrolase